MRYAPTFEPRCAPVNVNRNTLALGVAVVVIGLAIGAALAVLTRGGTGNDRQLTTVNRSRTERPAAPRPRVQPTALVAAATVTAPPGTPPPTPPPAATPAPTRVPTPIPTSTPTPARAKAAVPADPANGPPAVRGTWQLDEANVHVGTIVWVGRVVPSGNGTVALDVHKERVGGRPAVPCERQTQLHAALAAAAGVQTVPYTEVNCSGAASTGELRVTALSADGTSFTGSFWADGAKLGDVRATRL